MKKTKRRATRRGEVSESETVKGVGDAMDERPREASARGLEEKLRILFEEVVREAGGGTDFQIMISLVSPHRVHWTRNDFSRTRVPEARLRELAHSFAHEIDLLRASDTLPADSTVDVAVRQVPPVERGHAQRVTSIEELLRPSARELITAIDQMLSDCEGEVRVLRARLKAARGVVLSLDLKETSALTTILGQERFHTLLDLASDFFDSAEQRAQRESSS